MSSSGGSTTSGFAGSRRMSTRRLRVRPSTVSSVTNGSFSPRASVATLMPIPRSAFATAAARRADSGSFTGGSPEASACPTTSTLIAPFGRYLSASASSAMSARWRALSVASLIANAYRLIVGGAASAMTSPSERREAAISSARDIAGASSVARGWRATIRPTAALPAVRCSASNRSCAGRSCQGACSGACARAVPPISGCASVATARTDIGVSVPAPDARVSRNAESPAARAGLSLPGLDDVPRELPNG